jgi:transposase
MLDKCPCAASILKPTLVLKNCPECGEENELLSTEMKRKCSKCGFIIYNDVTSCVQWCEYARECVGDELFERLMGNEQAPDPKGKKGGK